ncbi:uncharacterized protein ACMZJ9_020534, partial [Mantella aurantiaca]
MEKAESHMTEKILNLTLEIIYLLTGEGFPPKNLGDYITITKPSPHSMTPQRQNMEKILEVTQKMIGLLTGEVPIRCQDVTVYFSMEEWEYLEGHKDLYKDVMMDNQPPLTSPDGSSNRNPQERCSRPLYSQDSTQEDLTIPHHHQVDGNPPEMSPSSSGNLEDYNIVVKEEYKEEDEEYGVMEEFSEEYKHVQMVAPHNRNSTQHEELIDMKFEVKEEEEETFVGGDQQSTEEDLEMVTIDPEESSIKISTGYAMEKPSKDHLTLSPGCKMEDEDITGEKTMISSMDGGDHSVDRSWDPSDQHCTVRDGAAT